MQPSQDLLGKLQSRQAKIGVIGLGYVGLPLALEFSDKGGYAVTGFDIDPDKVKHLEEGTSYIRHISSDRIQRTPRLSVTTDFARLADMDVILICVPTPVGEHREPDLSYILTTTETIAQTLRPGQLIVLESTTFPGTTDDIVRPILEKGGLKAGEDFYLAFSPEREDPNNPDYSTTTIAKVIGGYSPRCLERAKTLYDTIITKTVPVSSTRVAELVKLDENTFRAVAIARVNELKILCDKMGIDVWEVIDAASTKPFGYMRFSPGPGIGGHCIPVDPFYLTWKAREYDFPTRFIELAGELNAHMPNYVVQKVAEALNGEQKAVNGAKILILGIAYKKDIDDQRESPAFPIIHLLQRAGATVAYNDPYAVFEGIRHFSLKIASVDLTPENLHGFDAVVLVTDHSSYDYPFILEHAKLIVDTRDAFRAHGVTSPKIHRA
ncbi:nucleotide sugar dehydrogenase [Candidatus Berkelbacteria bacterium]|nr:nucleotide sugar dehydrogenase [Candidatus Berkelbacteria bacterium]